MDYSLEALGAVRDQEYDLCWIIMSPDTFAEIFAVLQVRLGSRYHYALTARPRTGDPLFPYRRSDNSFGRRLKNNSGELPAAEWGNVQGLFEEILSAREASLRDS